jgi:hypothetical protein
MKEDVMVKVYIRHDEEVAKAYHISVGKPYGRACL